MMRRSAAVWAMTDIGKAVELLRDGRGIYGIGVSDAFNIDARSLILRPDMLDNNEQEYHSHPTFAVLQRITSAFRFGMFAHSCEERLRRLVHLEALDRAGLFWPPDDGGRLDLRYWSEDNREIYHGLRRESLHIMNRLIGQAIDAAADPIALKIARRFRFIHREIMYRAGARSRHALQLAESFPVLALFIYYWRDMPRARENWRRGVREDEATVKERRARVQEAIALVERGVRLRDIAAVMQVPMAMRRIKSGAAHLAEDWHKAEWIVSCMPDSLPRMRTWLRAVRFARITAGPEFAKWTAKHVLELPGQGIGIFLQNTADWIRASNGRDGQQFVVRPFSPDMSLRTVTKLSAQWHEAVASRLDGPQHAFPPPWIAGTSIDGLDIIPIDHSGDLYREGAIMHHCVGIYRQDVILGRYYVYSIRRNGKRIATVGLVRKEGRPTLQQIRGPCNVEASGEIKTTVQRWLRSNSQTQRGNQIPDTVPGGVS
jgi:hypothetical protein